MDTKICTKCNIIQEKTNFGKRSSAPDGLCYFCKTCKSIQDSNGHKLNRPKRLAKMNAYYENNKCNFKKYGQLRYKIHKTEIDAKNKYWAQKNPESRRIHRQKWLYANLAARKEYLKAYYESNKGLLSERAARRRRGIEQAMPKWLSAEHLKEIKIIYQSRADGFHVDHIVPIKGKTVCGLHVPWNLQILSAIENLKKGNKF